MNFLSAYYLCLLYLTVAFKPLVPIIQDVWAHQFNGIEHIATVHARFGSHHMEKEIADHNVDDRGKSDNTLKPADDVPFHTLTQTAKYDFALTNSVREFHLFAKNGLPLIAIAYQAPPPKFS